MLWLSKIKDSIINYKFKIRKKKLFLEIVSKKTNFYRPIRFLFTIPIYIFILIRVRKVGVRRTASNFRHKKLSMCHISPKNDINATISTAVSNCF